MWFIEFVFALKALLLEWTLDLKDALFKARELKGPER